MNSDEMMKVKVINNYMSLVDLNNVNTLDYKKIENELAVALNERPAVKFVYDVETSLNEDGKIDKRVETLKTVEVYYTYSENGELKYGKQSYVIA